MARGGLGDDNSLMFPQVELAGLEPPGPLLAKLGESVQHSPWPGTERSERPPEYSNVQACWCRLWVSWRPTEPIFSPVKELPHISYAG
jgi:hypothetical protein